MEFFGFLIASTACFSGQGIRMAKQILRRQISNTQKHRQQNVMGNKTNATVPVVCSIRQSQVLTARRCNFVCLYRQEYRLFRTELFCKVLRYHVQSCLNRTSPQGRHFKQTIQLNGCVGPWQVSQQRRKLLTPAESASRAGTTFPHQEIDGNVLIQPVRISAAQNNGTSGSARAAASLQSPNVQSLCNDVADIGKG